MYRAVAPDENVRFDEVTPYNGALEALGFRRLARVAVGASSDSATQVWVSRDGEAYAEPEWMPGHKPWLSFRTAFADGAILQTSTPREGWIRHAPFWTRQHHPGAGYFLDERAAMPHELWARHKAHAAELAKQRGTTIPPHDPVPLFLQLADRSLKLARKRSRVAQLSGLAAFLAAAIPLSLNRDTTADWLLPLTALVWLAVAIVVFRLTLRTRWPRPRPFV